MIRDALHIFDNKVTMAGGTFNIGTTQCTSSLDTFAAGSPLAAGVQGAIGGPLLHDIGRGNSPKLRVQITTAAVGATATLSAQVIQGDDGALTTNKEVLLQTPAIAVATLVAGYKFRLPFPEHGVTRRFVGTQYVIATANFTAGALDSCLLGCGDVAEDSNADILG